MIERKKTRRHRRLRCSLPGGLSLALTIALLTPCVVRGAETEGTRSTAGLQVLYDFRDPTGDVVHDQSESGVPVDLRVTRADAVRRAAGEIEFLVPTLVVSHGPARRLAEAIRRSGAITVEAWVRPADTKQTGPARIVTLSRNPNERNFTLGQDGDRFEVRLRTTRTGGNGVPGLASRRKTAGTDWCHVVYTWDRTRTARLYIDGKQDAERKVEGDLANWVANFEFGLGNEISKDRPWRGGLRLIAIYDRALAADEIGRHYRLGPRTRELTDAERLAMKRQENGKLFATAVAPLLSQQCLECHDAATHQGQLDLSSRAAVLEAMRESDLLVAGKPEESLLWALVESDEMPHEREPLAAADKATLKRWIADGAVWSLDRIDPAVYEHGSGGGKLFVQRLTVPEYIETVRSTLGLDVSEEAHRLLPPDVRADGFRNTAYNLNVDLGHVEAYSRLAEIVASRVDIAELCRPHTRSRELTDENVTKVLKPVGLRLLRGPLSKEEITRYCGVSTSVAAAGGDFHEAMRYVLEAMLQSPRFLYRIERQYTEGAPRPVGPYELASRLSYILWGGPPDDTLLAAADQGRLDRAGVAAQAKRMLGDPRAIARSKQFVSEWLKLDSLANLRPGPERFPQWNDDLAADMRAETLAFFEEVAWKQERPLSELLDAQVTFVTPRLARHYDLPETVRGKADELTRVDLRGVPSRGGLLTQGSVLTVGGDDASMVTRGLFVLHELLRGVVRDPPPCVDTTPVESEPGLTQRMVSEQRIANKSCTACHVRFEPLAFGLEKYDGLGTFREKDEFGNELREDGRILFPGDQEPITYETAKELMAVLAESDRVRESLTWKLTQFALGRPLGPRDAPIVGDIHRRAQEAGGTYAATITAIVTSDLVLHTWPESAD